MDSKQFEVTHTDEEWRRLDKNGDGWLTPDETR